MSEIQGKQSTWHIHDTVPDEITNQTSLSKMLVHLLWVRGHDTPEKIQNFVYGFKPHDPLLLPDMQDAVDRITQAMSAKEKIAIYGDFDCDGISSAAILATALKGLKIRPTVIIPQRKEGHALADHRLAQLKEKGVSLVITTDCGTGSEAEIRKSGLDVIVTDHHLDETHSNHHPLVNPVLERSKYPFGGLSGAGVAGKLVQALTGDILPIIDLVALGTIADVVPLIDENRKLVQLGLPRMMDRPGLQVLLKQSAIKNPSATDIAFSIAPKINSANRLGNTRVAYNLLMAKDAEEAKPLAVQLDTWNRERQELLRTYTTMALELIEDTDHLAFVYGPWPTGMNGLIASKLSDQFGVPAIVAGTDSFGSIVASARSQDVSILPIIEGAAQYLRHYGGHTHAAGFVADNEHLDDIYAALQSAAQHIQKSSLALEVDAQIYMDQITSWATHQLETLQPWGQEFPEPLFLVRNVYAIDKKTIGNGNHLRLAITDGKRTIQSVMFSHDPELEELDESTPIDCVFNLQNNTFAGKTNVQLLLRDWRPVS